MSGNLQSGKSFARLIWSCGLWNLELNSWNPELSLRNLESEAIGVRNPSSTDKESGIQYLESSIHNMESTNEDFLGLPSLYETRTAPHMRLTELTLSQFILVYGITVY